MWWVNRKTNGNSEEAAEMGKGFFKYSWVVLPLISPSGNLRPASTI
jgi:hypothetical protein